jgi:hypothetical protein
VEDGGLGSGVFGSRFRHEFDLGETLAGVSNLMMRLLLLGTRKGQIVLTVRE